MYILVIPTSHTIDTEPLIYFCPENFESQIRLGSLVEIPIRTSMTSAVVSDIGVEIPIWLEISYIRSIVRVVCTTPLLAQNTLRVIPEIAELSLVPIHKVLSLFLPKSTLTALEKKNFEVLVSWWAGELVGKLEAGKLGWGEAGLQVRRLESEAELIEKKQETKNLGTWKLENLKTSDLQPAICNLQPNHTIEFFHSTRVTPAIIETYLTPNTLVILPDDILLRSCEQYFTRKSSIWDGNFLWKQILFAYGDTTITRKIRGWVDVRNHKFSICFWTRRLLYYNLSKYQQILYIEDGFAREYFQHPLRYKHIDILRALSKYSSLDIRILTSIPALETLSKLRNFSIHNITWKSTPNV